MKSLITLLFSFTSIIYSQSSSSYSQRPIRGLTYIPNASELIIEDSYLYGRSISYFNSEKELFYNELTGGLAEPVENLNLNTLNLGIGISSRAGLSIALPYIFAHDIKSNPANGYERNFPDILGDTGFGDLQISTWYLIFNDNNFRILLEGAVKLPVTEAFTSRTINFINSTSEGCSIIILGASFENEISNHLLVSAAFNYAYKAEREINYSNQWFDQDNNSYTYFYKITLKPGDEVNIGLKTSYDIFNNFAVGMEGLYNTKNNVKIEGSKQENSYSNQLIVSPILGYLYDFVALNFGYRLTVAGQNVSKMNYLIIDVQFSLGL